MTTSRRSRQMTFDGGSQEPTGEWRPALFATPQHHDHHPGNPDRVRRFGSKHGGRNLNDEAAAGIVPLVAGSSPPATPASRSATPGSGPARMTPGTSGRGFSDCLPRSTPTVLRGFVSRMSEGTSAWGSTVCSLTWTTSATPQRRGLFLLRASARSTAGTGCGSSDAERIPTPQSRDYRTGGADRWVDSQTVGDRSQNLNDWAAYQSARMYPTPDASGEKFRLSGDSQQSRCLEAMARRGELDGTPPRSGQKLNPAFVSRLMGYPDGWLDLTDSDPA